MMVPVASAAAATHRYQRRLPSRALELVQSGGDQPAAGRAHRMAERDGAAVDVDLVPVDAVHLLPGTDDRRERLVHLEDVDVADRHPGLGQHLAGRGDRPVEVVVGVGADQHLRDHPARGRKPAAFARPSDIHSTAAAPSEICDELPAVWMPSGSTALSPARPSLVVSRRPWSLVDDADFAVGPSGP